MPPLPALIEVSPQLLTSGQPAPGAFAALARVGVEVVINLAPPGSSGYNHDEAQLVLESGMIYAHLPIIWSAPRVAEWDGFAALLQTHRERRVLVHCAKNMRVAAFVYLYQTLIEGEDESMARARLLRVWQPDATWSRFMAEARAQF